MSRRERKKGARSAVLPPPEIERPSQNGHFRPDPADAPVVEAKVEAPRHDGPAVLRTTNLAKHYGKSVIAVADLSLTLRPGEIYGFLGPNGAGKTTTILMLLGIEQPTSGQIELFGKPYPLDPYSVKRRIGVVSEQQYLYDDLTAWEYLMFFARLYQVPRAQARAQELLERLKLYEFHRLRARDFSRGMQQKLGLARALLHQPELLILDEPVSGLDPHGIRQVRELLVEQNHRGVSMLISSHILSEVERTAHRVGILFGGRLVAEDTVEHIGAKLRPDASITLEVDSLAPSLVEALRNQPYVSRVDVTTKERDPAQGTLRVSINPGPDRRRAISGLIAQYGGIILQMRQEHVSLEEAFIQLTSENVKQLAADAKRGLTPLRSGGERP
jgi:ABC-2 type transport system ATP-binding protein